MVKGPRILLWDIETDGLQADRIMCIGYKWAGENKVYLKAYDNYANRNPWWSDKALVEDFSSIYNSCDYHVTWYGKRFDKTTVETKLIKWGLPPLAPKFHIDLWETARYQFKHYSNRLQAWQDLLGTAADKTIVKASVWIDARYAGPAPDKKAKAALKYIYNHCKADIEVLEEVFLKMRPWINKLPQTGIFTGEPGACTACGSLNVKQTRTYTAGVMVYDMFQCQDCGRHMRARRGVRAPSNYAA